METNTSFISTQTEKKLLRSCALADSKAMAVASSIALLVGLILFALVILHATALMGKRQEVLLCVQTADGNYCPIGEKRIFTARERTNIACAGFFLAATFFVWARRRERAMFHRILLKADRGHSNWAT